MSRKRGRPQFQPTAKQRRQVAIAAGGGMSHEEISLGLGISRNTLEKHFAEELSTGAYRKRLEAFEALHASAKRGNVAAIKAYTSMSPRVAAPPLNPDPPAAKPAEPEGKKAQAQAQAATAQQGTEWETLLKPPGTSIQ